jgi:hypothetical protein
MSLKDYLNALQALVEATPFVTVTSLSYEERPPSAGLIKGSILFADGSQLDVKEFLITQPALHVIKYGYHYRMGTQLTFRYDNATDPAARNLSTFPSHKHIPSGLLAAEKPALEQVLREIVSQLKVL